MSKLFDELFIYEKLLLAYYSKEGQAVNILYNDKMHIIMDRFLEIFIDEDMQKGTNHVSLIKKIYANPQFNDNNDFYKYLNISSSTLRRYRERYCSTLKLVIERFAESNVVIIA